MNRSRAFWLYILALLCLVAALGCATGSKTESFTSWTRHYEVRMGLEEPTEIRFGPTPLDSCGWVGYEQQIGRRGPELVLVTYYDPEMEGCRPPWDVALHEACHRRMQHHWIGRSIEDTEAEAKYCERWYS